MNKLIFIFVAIVLSPAVVTAQDFGKSESQICSKYATHRFRMSVEQGLECASYTDSLAGMDKGFLFDSSGLCTLILMHPFTDVAMQSFLHALNTLGVAKSDTSWIVQDANEEGIKYVTLRQGVFICSQKE